MTSLLITRQDVIKHSRNMPIFPRIISEILATLDDPDGNLNLLVGYINLDPVIAARVLSVANMAAVRGRRDDEVRDIFTATSLIGMSRVRHITMISSLGAYIGGMAQSVMPSSFWQHNVAVGVCCEELASHVCVPVSTDAALVAGLLHDIGQLWLFGYNAEAARKCWHVALTNKRCIAQVELETFGVDHATMGAWLAEYWALPQGIAAAIRGHHAPDLVADVGPEANLVPLVHVAEVLSNALDLTGRAQNQVTTVSAAACRQLGLVWDADIRSLFGRMEARSSHANSFFSAPVQH